MFVTIIKFFLYFILLSFGGYIVEVLYCSLANKKIINRGFFFGPICPIYGVGALCITLTLSKYQSDPFIIFIMGLLLTSIIEYYTSYILEKIFHNKWWDYSYRWDNINGRICLKNSILFGIGSLFIIYLINPYVNKLFAYFSDKFIIIFGIIIFIVFMIDWIASLVIAYNLRNRIIIAEELKSEKLKMIPILIEKKYKKQIENLKFASNRLLKVFPDISKNMEKELDYIKKVNTKNKKSKK